MLLNVACGLWCTTATAVAAFIVAQLKSIYISEKVNIIKKLYKSSKTKYNCHNNFSFLYYQSSPEVYFLPR